MRLNDVCQGDSHPSSINIAGTSSPSGPRNQFRNKGTALNMNSSCCSVIVFTSGALIRCCQLNGTQFPNPSTAINSYIAFAKRVLHLKTNCGQGQLLLDISLNVDVCSYLH
jgi:hypothetical protein